jgi:MoxR-like ATPase
MDSKNKALPEEAEAERRPQKSGELRKRPKLSVADLQSNVAADLLERAAEEDALLAEVDTDDVAADNDLYVVGSPADPQESDNSDVGLGRFDLVTEEDLVIFGGDGLSVSDDFDSLEHDLREQKVEDAQELEGILDEVIVPVEAVEEEAINFQVDADQKKHLAEYHGEKSGLMNIGTPEALTLALAEVGYHCPPFLAAQVALCLNTKTEKVRSMLLEGPPGCGKSFLAKSLAKIADAEFMNLSCYNGMNYQHLIEMPSTLAMVNAMAGKGSDNPEELLNLGVLSRAFVKSQEGPVVLLIDEIDKVDDSIDTFFLGPLQDAAIWPESRPPIEANVDNLLIIFTKNYERSLNDALMRRVHPVELGFLDANVEKKVLGTHCLPQIVGNLSHLADVMRYSDGSYEFERPPAPEELLTVGRYLMQLLEWDIVDFGFMGRNVWSMLAKSDNDRFVLELMLRYHPEFYDSLHPNGRKLSLNDIHAKLGRLVLKGVVADPDDISRRQAYKADHIGLTNVGTPEQLTQKLAEVGYECLPYLAIQVSLLLNTPFDRVRALLMEGPPGCGKSFMAKCLARITGADFMCMSCYEGMNTQHLIEQPSTLGLANAMSKKGGSKEKLVNLGILSRAYLKSQNQPVILLIDEIDKTEVGIDTFFLGPIQDGTVYLESRPPIDANVDNLLLVFTKNYVRQLNDALLRRVHPIEMTYLDSEMEKRILNPHCDARLISNIIGIVDRMRHSGGSYGFDRPPAPEEILIVGHYVNNLLKWGITDFETVGRNVWSSICKSEHDRAVLEHMMRFHPDFLDPLKPDGKGLKIGEVHSKLGRTILDGIVADPDKKKREQAWDTVDYDY